MSFHLQIGGSPNETERAPHRGALPATSDWETGIGNSLPLRTIHLQLDSLFGREIDFRVARTGFLPFQRWVARVSRYMELHRLRPWLSALVFVRQPVVVG